MCRKLLYEALSPIVRSGFSFGCLPWAEWTHRPDTSCNQSATLFLRKRPWTYHAQISGSIHAQLRVDNATIFPWKHRCSSNWVENTTARVLDVLDQSFIRGRLLRGWRHELAYIVRERLRLEDLMCELYERQRHLQVLRIREVVCGPSSTTPTAEIDNEKLTGIDRRRGSRISRCNVHAAARERVHDGANNCHVMSCLRGRLEASKRQESRE